MEIQNVYKFIVNNCIYSLASFILESLTVFMAAQFFGGRSKIRYMILGEKEKYQARRLDIRMDTLDK